MTLASGPNLGLLVDGAAGETHYAELMRQFRGLDFLVQCSVINRSTATPPTGMADGDAYLIAASPTGAWTGHAGKLARWSTKLGSWEIFTPKAGWRAYVVAETVNLTYNGTSWQNIGGGGGGGGSITSVTGTAGRVVADDPDGPAIVLDLVPTGVTPGTYPAATVTVDAWGRITNIVASSILAIVFTSPGFEVKDLVVMPNPMPMTFVPLNYV
jgi:hypothetical protein